MEGERDPRTYAIIGAAMEVHQQLGHGFLEPVYQEAMAIELGLVAIPFQKEVELPVLYKAVSSGSSCASRSEYPC
jgi:GxxExxY protein